MGEGLFEIAMFKPFELIAGKHEGTPIVVMGGAPCLPDDLKKIQHDALYISANEHGAKIRTPDYVVALDLNHPIHGTPMADLLAHIDAPKISKHRWADYVLPSWHNIGKVNSGIASIIVAQLLGAHPVIVTGIELYTGGGDMHFDDSTHVESLGKGADYARGQIESLLSVIPDPDAVRVVSGPLTEHFAEYDPDESFGEYAKPSIVGKMQRRRFKAVRFKKARRFPFGKFEVGDIGHLTISQARYVTSMRFADEV